MREILVTGASGLVGSRFEEMYSHLNLLTPSQEELNIMDQKSVDKYFSSHSFSAVINFAAYTNVGEAEKQRNDKKGECWRLNVDGVVNLLDALEDRFFIQVSTDMVFPGSAERPGPYLENDKAEVDSAQLTWYGFTKAEAERKVTEGAVVRICNPVRASFDRKPDYLRKTLKLYREGKLYSLFDDQHISITFIDEVCLALEKLLDNRVTGVFHVSSSDMVTPYEFYKYAINKLYDPGFGPEHGTIDQIENKVRYPKFGGLQSLQTQEQLQLSFKSWKEIIDELVKQGIKV